MLGDAVIRRFHFADLHRAGAVFKDLCRRSVVRSMDMSVPSLGSFVSTSWVDQGNIRRLGTQAIYVVSFGSKIGSKESRDFDPDSLILPLTPYPTYCLGITFGAAWISVDVCFNIPLVAVGHVWNRACKFRRSLR